TFSLNQSGIEKIEAIKYLRILEEILNKEIDKSTKKSYKKVEFTAQKNILKILENGYFKKENIKEIVEVLQLEVKFKKKTDALTINFEYKLEIDILDDNYGTEEKNDSPIVSGIHKKILFILSAFGINRT
ncbi:MAG: hypothetical protein Q9M94_02885, partial [Candidatus Gracilibacteria bacterium]|nr:hypothetical protein [Candidatus Gracilibacteria bacterium]